MDLGPHLHERLSAGFHILPRNQTAEYERLLGRIQRIPEIGGMSRNEVLVTVYDALQSMTQDQYLISLILALVDSTYTIHTLIESTRPRIAASLHQELTDEEDLETRGQIAEEIKIINSQRSFPELITFFKSRDREFAQTTRKSAPFEGPFIRTAAEVHKGDTRWASFRERASTVLGLSEESVASMRAWKSENLKGGKTVEMLIEEMRTRLNGAAKKDEQPARPSAVKTMRDPLPPTQLEPEDHNALFGELYSLIGNEVFVTELLHSEPDLSQPRPLSVTPKLHYWILLCVAACKDEKAKKRSRQILSTITGLTTPTIGALTAYLVGKCRTNVKNQELLSMIEKIEQLVAGKRELVDQVEKISTLEAPLEPVADTNLIDPEIDDNDFSNPVIEAVERTIGEAFYDNPSKAKGWREPLAEIIRKTWGNESPLRGKRILLLDDPNIGAPDRGLLEAKMYLSMGAREENLTFIERDTEKARFIKQLMPNAAVQATSIIDYFAGIARDRLSRDGVLEKWREKGVTDKNPRTYVSARAHRSTFPQERFEWLLADSNCWLFHEYAENPVFQHMDIPPYSSPTSTDPQFDVISLDTLGRFSSLRWDISLAARLGLLRDNGVMATNFVGQRESAQEQLIHAKVVSSMRTSDMLEGRNKPSFWLDRDTSTSQLRSDTVTSQLRTSLYRGRGCQDPHFSGNLDSPITQASIKALMNMSTDRFAKLFAAFIIGHDTTYSGTDILTQEDRQRYIETMYNVLITRSYEYCIRYGLNELAMNVFSPVLTRNTYNRFPTKIQKKVLELNVVDPLANEKNTPLFPGQSIGVNAADLLLTHWDDGMYVSDATATQYRGGKTTMIADFMHAKKTARELSQIPPEFYTAVNSALVKGVPISNLKGFSAQDLVNYCVQFREYLARRAVTHRNITSREVIS